MWAELVTAGYRLVENALAAAGFSLRTRTHRDGGYQYHIRLRNRSQDECAPSSCYAAGDHEEHPRSQKMSRVPRNLACRSNQRKRKYPAKM